MLSFLSSEATYIHEDFCQIGSTFSKISSEIKRVVLVRIRSVVYGMPVLHGFGKKVPSMFRTFDKDFYILLVLSHQDKTSGQYNRELQVLLLAFEIVTRYIADFINPG